MSILRWEWARVERIFTETIFSNLSVLTLGAPLISECVQLKRLNSPYDRHSQADVSPANPAESRTTVRKRAR